MASSNPAIPTVFERETRIRDYCATNLDMLRPQERVIGKEFAWTYGGVRADLRTVDKDDVLRDWEFKIEADYCALGQILTYVALTRQHTKFQRRVVGVIAAFSFHPLLKQTIETMNLGIELVEIPSYLALAGMVPLDPSPKPGMPDIPKLG